MSVFRNSLSRNLGVELVNNPLIVGLEEFKKQLEKDYFSDVQIRDCSTKSNICHLIIELDCNLHLEEAVLFLNKSGWANQNSTKSSLSDAVHILEKQNDFEIEIEEFSIFLNDSSIVIKRIHKHSVQEQLCTLLHKIAEHHDSITRSFKETPYEIYIPVFEEDIIENDIKLAAIEQGKNDSQDYYTYWGLYFESEDDALIYELPKKRIIGGELLMLNH